MAATKAPRCDMAAIITRSSTPRLLPERCVELQWSDGTTSRYHYVWLRQLHFHPATGRPDQAPDAGFRLPDEPESLVAEKCWVENGDLVVPWSNDGAETRHSLGWLKWNAYDEEHRRQRKAELVTWTGVQASRFGWHRWDEVMNDDDALWALFATLRDRGLVRLVGAPVEEGAIARLATRFGPLRVTDYGAISDIRSIPRAVGRYANIGASGHHRLGPHTDEGWRYAQPGIAFHLCLEQAPGGTGAALLIDGLLAAERLRERNREAFELLTCIPFRFVAARNPEERYFAHGRLIVTDQDGDIVGVRFSDRTLGVQDLPSNLIEPAYRALRAFAKELYADNLVYRHALAPGEMHVFDNHRVMHARESFDPELGPRRIQSCAVDREEFHNRLRQLAESLGYLEDLHMIFPNGALG